MLHVLYYQIEKFSFTKLMCYPVMFTAIVILYGYKLGDNLYIDFYIFIRSILSFIPFSSLIIVVLLINAQ